MPLFLILALLFIPGTGFGKEFSEKEMARIKLESMKDLPERTKSSPAGRAKFVVETFEQACFSRFFEPQRIVDFANTFLSPVPEEKAAKFRSPFQSKQGLVWWGLFPEGGISLVYDKDTNRCHVAGYEGDQEAFHKEMEFLSQRAEKNIPGTDLEYSLQKDQASGTEMSVVKIKFKDERGYIILIVGSTPLTPVPENPKSLLTIQAVKK